MHSSSACFSHLGYAYSRCSMRYLQHQVSESSRIVSATPIFAASAHAWHDSYHLAVLLANRWATDVACRRCLSLQSAGTHSKCRIVDVVHLTNLGIWNLWCQWCPIDACIRRRLLDDKLSRSQATFRVHAKLFWCKISICSTVCCA